MANPEHVEILKQGVDVWNAWREEKHSVRPDLSLSDFLAADLKGAYLARCNLRNINFRGANLEDANFDHSDLWSAVLNEANLSKAFFYLADLQYASLKHANLIEADFRHANLRGAKFFGAYLSGAYLGIDELVGPDLTNADLRDAILVGVTLIDANFLNANLDGADFKGAKIERLNLGNVDLGKIIGLDTVEHRGPSTLGINTIKKSKGKIPEVFLRGCGLSDMEIEIVKLWRKGMDRNEVTDIAYDLVNLYCGDGLQYYSCFISYNSADEAFARKLHDDLQDNGVRCWFAPEDLKIGDRIRPRIDQEIRLRDKLLVILSENSVESEWVGDEVEAALEEERMDGRTILFPIRLDDAVMEARLDWAAKIRRRRHTGDFTGWQEEAQYQQVFQRLLRDLKATGGE